MESPEHVPISSFIVVVIDGRFLSHVAIATAIYMRQLCVNDIHGPTGILFQFYYNITVSSVYLEFPIPGT